MVPVSLETGYGLSETVRRRIPQLVRAALDVLVGWGVDVPVAAVR